MTSNEAAELLIDPLVRRALLYRPPLPSGSVPRGELLADLDAGVSMPVSLICAPTGFGKSVLASEWCEHIDQHSSWLSLDPAIDQPRRFLLHLIAAIRRVFPDALETTAQMASAGPLPADDALIAELCDELDELDQRIVVVLDDYQHVTEPRVHRFVADLISHDSAGIHLLIVTREEPPLPIATLRSQGRLPEVRMADLAFSVDELRLFVHHELGRSLDPQRIDDLHAATEGWAAGARLAAQAFGGGDGDGDAIVGAGFLNRSAQDYLAAEVIERVPAQVRDHLITISYFDRFSAELCDAIAGTASAGASTPAMTGVDFVDYLQQHNLFVVPLDEHGKWYRFHHQFARLLADWRTSSNIAISERELRRTAASVFRDHGMFDEAITQLDLASADRDLADVAATHGNQLVEQQRWVELENLLSDIPTRVLDSDAELLILKARLLGMVLFRHREMQDVLDRVDMLLDQDAGVEIATVRRIRGQVATLRGAYVKLVQSDFEGAVTDAEVARQQLSEHPGPALVFAYTLGVMGLAGAGRHDDAHQLADALRDDPRFAGIPIDTSTWARLTLAWLEGDLVEMGRYAEIARSIGERLGLPGTVAAAHYFSGACAYEQNRLVDAERHLTTAFDQRFTAEAILAVEAGAALASTELALGRPGDAGATTEALVRFVLDTRSEFLRPVAEGFSAQFDLRCGRTGPGLRWARGIDFPLAVHGFMWFDAEPTVIEILLASEPDAARGRLLLDRALESARRHHRPLTIQLLGVHALDLATRGNEAEAVAVLAEAVRLGRDGGIVRRLADLGPRLHPLLDRVDATADLLAHIGAIRTAIDPPTHNPSDSTPVTSTSVAGQPTLTGREAEVLELLAVRRSNKEIAEALTIAPATVKKHTVTLFDKLGVNGRREAVATARTLGYLAHTP